MNKEAIILAGGLGTRLRTVVSDLPKCMAPVAGKPFIYYILENLIKQKVEHFIFSVGYKSESITNYIKENYSFLKYSFAIEESPLGTGGAIKNALTKTQEDNILILNGDTLFDVDIDTLYQFNNNKNSSCTLCLKPMSEFERYGVVEMKEDNSISSFKEKKYYKEGLINGGIYLLNKKVFQSVDLPEKFSFEKDFLEQYYTQYQMFGFVQDHYFIDIGIPEDYERAQIEFKMRIN